MALLVSSIVVAALAAHVLAVPATAAKPVTVKLKDSFFSPSRVTLSPGGSVRFVWAGELTHNLLGPGIPGRLEDPATRRKPFIRVFRHRGLVLFTCSIHPGMDMTVRVR